MLSLLLCLAAFILAYVASRRSLVLGLVVVLAVGYVYGIVRANVIQTFSHFIFDAAAGGFYLAVFRRSSAADTDYRTRPLRNWMLLLVGWPLLLLFIPVQDPLVQLVGFRGSVFLIPILVVGARLTDEEMLRFALAVGIMNIAAFAVAVAEYVIGVEPFFPRSAVTELIYRSRDVAGNTAHRIPSTFTSAHAYAATMASTCAILVGAWLQPNARYKTFFGLAALATSIGVFMAAARTHMVVLGLVFLVATSSTQVRLGRRIAWVLVLLVMGYVVSRSERLQRFKTIDSTEVVSSRLETSVNANFLKLAQDYPLGNGLGGGGTSLPYFLEDRIKERIGMENEYARIMLEQGIPGLLIWAAFIMWAFMRSPARSGSSLTVAPQLMWTAAAAYFASSVYGTGLLTSVPHTTIVLLYVGWLCARRPRPGNALRVPADVHIPSSLVAAAARRAAS